MSQLTKLEHTIIAHATKSVLEMKSYAKDNMPDEYIGAFHESSALLCLAMVSDSGLSAQAISELEAVRKERIRVSLSYQPHGAGEGETLSWQDAVAMGLTPVNANDGDKPLLSERAKILIDVQARRLPISAYEALEGLKEQAEAAVMMLPGEDNPESKKKLKQAQAKMNKNIEWVNLIVEALNADGNATTVATADNTWLERSFSGMAAIKSDVAHSNQC